MSSELTKQPIYMDCNATTPVDERVIEAMLPYFREIYGNTASTDHIFGLSALRAVDDAREQVAKLINCKAEEIIFTSGATESDNLALKGVAKKYREKGDHIISCSTEHKAVLDTCIELQKEGYKITYLPVDKFGKISLEQLETSISDKTILISIMAANNEIGTIADITKIGEIAHKHNVLFHTDAAQAVGHIPIDVKKMNIDLMSISAHKINGPKGVGALYCRGVGPRVRPSPIIHGGGHERGIRSGTINVPGVVGLGKALEISTREMKKENSRFLKWTKKMYDSIYQSLFEKTTVSLNGHPTDRLAHNLNIYIKGIENKALINYVQKYLAISAGSACTTTNMEASHVILALGHPEERAFSSIRIGLGRHNTESEIDVATSLITDAVIKLQYIDAQSID